MRVAFTYRDKISLVGIRPEILFAMIVADEIFKKHSTDGEGLIVTSVCDGTHSVGSLHYVGFAFDCRIWHIKTPEVVKNAIAERLPDEFDVVLEYTKGGAPSHIHIEYQPKKPKNVR